MPTPRSFPVGADGTALVSWGHLLGASARAARAALPRRALRVAAVPAAAPGVPRSPPRTGPA